MRIGCGIVSRSLLFWCDCEGLALYLSNRLLVKYIPIMGIYYGYIFIEQSVPEIRSKPLTIAPKCIALQNAETKRKRLPYPVGNHTNVVVGGGACCTIRKAGGGGGGWGGGSGCLADEREVHFIRGQLYYLLNSARFTIDFRNFNNSSAKI